jgi:hypothetical protein
MNTLKSIWIPILAVGLLLALRVVVSGEEASREIIDKTNWEKAEGLVPDCLLEWVKTGEFILPVGELEFDPYEFWPAFALESRQKNLGRFELNEKDELIDAKTGKLATFWLGFPCPNVDPDDPKAAVKIVYNKQYMSGILGPKRFTTFLSWIGRSGWERNIEVWFRDIYLMGCPQVRKYPNPKDMQRYSLVSIRRPYDMAGTASMNWRYLSAKQDVSYAYVPAIRRVRRTSPANRSDGMFGSDFTADDILAYDGKVPAFEWRLVGKQEALVPFVSEKILRCERIEKGEIMMSRDMQASQYGFHDQDWQGAPWCPLDIAYVKRPVWVIEATPKDRYYNYGKQYIWTDGKADTPYYKIVFDRAGKFWKLIMVINGGFQTDDKTFRIIDFMDHVIVDAKREHASYAKNFNPDTQFVWYANIDLNDFTLAGFQKYCK